MYSPAERPSKSRAAPAKNRIWSTMGGISSDMVRALGLPVFSHSTSTSSSARASMASAIRNRARLRSDGVVSRHPSKARCATVNASSTSATPESGMVAKTSPVEGFTRSTLVPSLVSA